MTISDAIAKLTQALAMLGSAGGIEAAAHLIREVIAGLQVRKHK